MDRRRFVRTGRALLILSLAAAMWAVAVALTGGFVLEAEALRVSSHSPWPAAAIALGSGLAGFLLTSRDERGRAFTTIRGAAGPGGAAHGRSAGRRRRFHRAVDGLLRGERLRHPRICEPGASLGSRPAARRSAAAPRAALAPTTSGRLRRSVTVRPPPETRASPSTHQDFRW